MYMFGSFFCNLYNKFKNNIVNDENSSLNNKNKSINKRIPSIVKLNKVQNEEPVDKRNSINIESNIEVLKRIKSEKDISKLKKISGEIKNIIISRSNSPCISRTSSPGINNDIKSSIKYAVLQSLNGSDSVKIEDTYDNSLISDVLCKNISGNLLRELGVDVLENETKSNEYIPPEYPGLENSDRVFSRFYLTNQNLHGKIFDIDFLFTIEDNIRNLRLLNQYQLEYLNSLSQQQLIDLIIEYNEAYKMIDTVLELNSSEKQL